MSGNIGPPSPQSLRLAIKKRNIEQVRMILDAGVDPNSKAPRQWEYREGGATPLHLTFLPSGGGGE